MRSTIWQFFSHWRKPAPSALRATEPELLPDWPNEVEREERRRRNIAALNHMAEREDREQTAAMPWWKRWRYKARRRLQASRPARPDRP